MSLRLKAEKIDLSLSVLNIETTKKVLKLSLQADQPVGIEGPPGVGKSAVVAAVAKELKMSFEPMILSLCDPTDIGGFPVVDGGQITRRPLGPIRRACETPSLLFLDELTCAPPAVQGAAMRLIYERWAGEDKLHPGTRIVCAYNPADQAAGGWELAMPLIGRMTKIKMMPEIEEIMNYLFELGAPESRLRFLSVDLSATLKVAPELIQLEPPSGASTSAKPWGAPRSWERALRVCAEAMDAKISDTSDIFASILAGNVGDEATAAFMTIRKVRSQLPSMDEIKKDPENCKLPTDPNTQVAIIGLLAQVALSSCCPAWVYASRLENETRLAALQTLSRFNPNNDKGSPFHQKAMAAQLKLIRTIAKLVQV